MGQQQLLLLVLGIVTVGIAVVAGIQAFSEGKGKARQDAAINDAMRMVSDVQAWKLKPGAYGGGSNTAEADFSDLTLRALGYPPSGAGDRYLSFNGCFMLTAAASGASIKVHTDSSVNNGGNCKGGFATITITGPDPDDISWNFDE